MDWEKITRSGRNSLGEELKNYSLSVGHCVCPVAQREEAALRFQVLGQSSYAISQLGKQASGGMSFKGKYVFRSPLK